MELKHKVNLTTDQPGQGNNTDPNLFQKQKQSERVSHPVTGRYFSKRKTKSKVYAEHSTRLGSISNGKSARLV